MNFLFICSTSDDCIFKIDLDKFKVMNVTKLKKSPGEKAGPHGLCSYKDKILAVNIYSNSLSVIGFNSLEEEENYYIGVHCNDIEVVNNNAYIICGDLNYLILFDLLSKRFVEEIPCGEFPHSIDIDRQKKTILVANMENDSITLIDINNKENIKSIRVGSYPTKAVFSAGGDYILVCESNLGADSRGSVAILSAKNFRLINRIPVGNSPVDMYVSPEHCFISNFGDGTVSIININNYKETDRIIVGGMPRGIQKRGRHVYIGDNYNNLLLEIDLLEKWKNTIAVGGEPTGMVMV